MDSEDKDSDEDDLELEALRLAALATLKSSRAVILKSESSETTTTSNASPAIQSTFPPPPYIRKEQGHLPPNQYSWRNSALQSRRGRGRGGFLPRGGFPKINQRSNLIVITPVSTDDKDSTEKAPAPQLSLPQHKWCQAANENSSSPKTYSRRGPTRFNRHESGSESDSDYDDPSDQDSYSNETILQDENSVTFAQLTPEESIESESPLKSQSNADHRLSFQHANLDSIQPAEDMHGLKSTYPLGLIADTTVSSSTLNDSGNRDSTCYSNYQEYNPIPSTSYQCQSVSAIPVNGILRIDQDYEGNRRRTSDATPDSFSVDANLSQDDLRQELKKRMLKLRSDAAELAKSETQSVGRHVRDERRTSDDFRSGYSRDHSSIHNRSRSDITFNTRARNRSRSLTRDHNRLRSPSPGNSKRADRNSKRDCSRSPNRNGKRSWSRSPVKMYRKTSDSPSRNNKRNYSRSPERSNKRNYSRSPERGNKRNYSRSPERSNKRNYSRSPERSNKRTYSRSPERSNKRNYSRTPERSSNRNYSRSPERSNKRNYSRSPERSNKRNYSRSPERSNKRNNSHSPKKSNKHNYSRSPERSNKRNYNRSPEWSNNRKYSRSPEKGNKCDKSRTPPVLNDKHDKSRTPLLSDKHDKSRTSLLSDKHDKSCSPERSNKYYYSRSPEQNEKPNYSPDKSKKQDHRRSPSRSTKRISSLSPLKDKSSHSPYKALKRSSTRSPDRTSKHDSVPHKSHKHSETQSSIRNRRRNSSRSPDKSYKKLPPKSPKRKHKHNINRSPLQSQKRDSSRSPETKLSRLTRDRSRSPVQSHRHDSSESPKRKPGRNRNKKSRRRWSRSSSGLSSSSGSGSSSSGFAPCVRSISSVIKPVQSSAPAVKLGSSSKDKRSPSPVSDFSSDLNKRKDLDEKPKALLSLVKSSIVVGENRNNASDGGKRLPVHMRLGTLPRNKLIQMTKDVEAAFVNTSSDEEANTDGKKQNYHVVAEMNANKDDILKRHVKKSPSKNNSVLDSKSQRKKTYR